jgi:YHS domain-containing protein
MKMRQEKETVEQYLHAFYTGDSATARRYLADDLMFSGPSASFSSADAFLRASAHVGSRVRAVHTRKLFVAGSDVGVFLELVLDDPLGTVPVAEWYHLDGEQIASIRTILDTAPFLARSRAPTTETAVDPVCHMTVEKQSAAATRAHEGTLYYFCNPGCADAFADEPDRYLAAAG